MKIWIKVQSRMLIAMTHLVINHVSVKCLLLAVCSLMSQMREQGEPEDPTGLKLKLRNSLKYPHCQERSQ